jgi:hypothetical protein
MMMGGITAVSAVDRQHRKNNVVQHKESQAFLVVGCARRGEGGVTVKV